MGSEYFGSGFDDFGGGAVGGAMGGGGGMGQLTELLMMAPELIGMIKGDDKDKKKKKKKDYYTGEPEGVYDSLDDGGLMSMMGQYQQQPSAQGSGKPGIGQLAKAGIGIYQGLK